MPGLQIQIQGVVQGVGFRPYIWRLAHELQLTGTVRNDLQGVRIEAWGTETALNQLIQQIPGQLPVLASITSMQCQPLTAESELSQFSIIHSADQGLVQTPVTADAAICPDCLTEIQNPQDRRFAYPFTNCTHCGPRLSVVNAVPYDRQRTSMAIFKMCPECQAEFDNPSDRRFHAQTNCCPVCGPQVWLEMATGDVISCSNPVQQAADALKNQKILALKGLGGFHLVCDAGYEDTVQQLRELKGRYAKPLGLMALDIAMIESFCELDTVEKKVLMSHSAPMVLLAMKQPLPTGIAQNIAAGQNYLGFMLPYTPLHYLLLQEVGRPLVMTSGNISDEPQCIDNKIIQSRLGERVDVYLMHNRPIINRLDDSVLKKMAGRMRVFRRGRGFTPEQKRLPDGFEVARPILAMGAEQKNSFAMCAEGKVTVSQYIGDLKYAAAYQEYRRQLTFYHELFQFQPQVIAVDCHSSYLATQMGVELAEAQASPLMEIQHHHAHAAAVMAEAGLPLDTKPVLAMTFDGLGLGEQQQLWGGEFLYCDYRQFKRLGCLQAVALPGGNQASLEPWRNTLAQLHSHLNWQQIQIDYSNLKFFRFLRTRPHETMTRMIERGINAPLSSSCGRWLDAAAALLGICMERVQYEGQAAIELENLAEPVFFAQQNPPYGFELQKKDGLWILNWRLFWQQLLQDLAEGVERSQIAARIHHTLVAAGLAMIEQLAQMHSFDTVILTCGVMQNRLILEALTERLGEQGYQVLSPADYPANDGGIALGQAVIAAAKDIAGF